MWKYSRVKEESSGIVFRRNIRDSDYLLTLNGYSLVGKELIPPWRQGDNGCSLVLLADQADMNGQLGTALMYMMLPWR